MTRLRSSLVSSWGMGTRSVNGFRTVNVLLFLALSRRVTTLDAFMAEYLGDLEEFLMVHFEEVMESVCTGSGENEEIMQRVRECQKEYRKWLERGGRSQLPLPR